MQFLEEHKKNISEAHKGMQFSEEHKKNISEARKGRHHSEEAKKKISESLKGKHHSEEAKKKISEKASKKVICVTTGKIFNSFKEASNYYKCSHISDCCKGTLKSAGKLPNDIPLKWKYVKDYNNDFKGILINPIIDKID